MIWKTKWLIYKKTPSSDKFLALTNQGVSFSRSHLSFILVSFNIPENKRQHCFGGTLVCSVLQKGMHWYKIKFPKKVITILHSNGSLYCTVVIKHMTGLFCFIWAGVVGGDNRGCVWVCSFSCHLERQLVLFFVLFHVHRALLCSTCGNTHCLGFHWCSLSLLFLPFLVFTSFLNVPQPTVWNRSSLCFILCQAYHQQLSVVLPICSKICY